MQQLYYKGGYGAGQGGVQLPNLIAGAAQASQTKNPWTGLWEAVARGGSQVLQVALRDYDRRQNNEIDQALNTMQGQFEEWKAAYNKEHQFQNAATAQKDYQDKFEELANTALDKFKDVEPIFRDSLKKRLAISGLQIMREGGQYQEAQDQRWQDSLIQGDIADLQRLAASDPANSDLIELQRAQTLQRMAERNPGKDMRSEQIKLDASIMDQRLSSLIAAGNFEQAEQLMQGNQQTYSSRSQANLAVHNFGNVMINDTDFAAYSDRHNGLMGIAERILRYNTASKWQAKSLLDMVSIYAPEKDGNNPRAYAAFLAMKTGKIDGATYKAYSQGQANAEQKQAVHKAITAAYDFHNVGELSKLVVAIPIMEHGAQTRINPGEALAAAQAILNGQRPRITGKAASKGQKGYSGGFILGADKIAYYQNQIAQAREQQARQQAQALGQDAFNRGLSYDQALQELGAGSPAFQAYDTMRKYQQEAIKQQDKEADDREYDQALDMIFNQDLTARDLSQLASTCRAGNVTRINAAIKRKLSGENAFSDPEKLAEARSRILQGEFSAKPETFKEYWAHLSDKDFAQCQQKIQEIREKQANHALRPMFNNTLQQWTGKGLEYNGQALTDKNFSKIATQLYNQFVQDCYERNLYTATDQVEYLQKFLAPIVLNNGWLSRIGLGKTAMPAALAAQVLQNKSARVLDTSQMPEAERERLSGLLRERHLEVNERNLAEAWRQEVLGIGRTGIEPRDTAK